MTSAEVEHGLAALIEKVERERGFQCASYKHSCLRRRIRTRMRVRGTDTYEEYMTVLDGHPREFDRLIEALTINVTRFFRNRHVWDIVAETVVPRVWANERPNVRAWSAGCASGEEAFSMAMLFHRYAAVNGMLGQINRVIVTGTDVDGGALGLAEAASYSEPDMEEVPAELRVRYFSATPPYQPAAGIRRMVRFARHDLLSDGFPGPRQDVIMCRNVLIYFERPVQELVIRRLQDSLEPGGYLILGKVESLLGTTRRGFEPVAQRERIFRKIS